MSFDGQESIAISQLRQFIFCPRIPWFTQNIDRDFKHPVWVEQGMKYQKRRETLLSKRPLFRATVKGGYSEKYDIAVRNPHLNIHGRVDLVLETVDETIPVEIKMKADKPTRGHLLQLMGYGLCLGDRQFPCRRGILLAGKRQRRFEVKFTDALRADFLRVLERMRQILEHPFLPHSSATLPKCLQCEYQNQCQDRDL